MLLTKQTVIDNLFMLVLACIDPVPELIKILSPILLILFIYTLSVLKPFVMYLVVDSIFISVFITTINKLCEFFKRNFNDGKQNNKHSSKTK